MDDVVQDLLKALPLGQIASQVDAQQSEVESAIAMAAPALLSGMNANAQSSGEGLMSLVNALASDHDGSLLEAHDPFGLLDLADGAKIVDHVFGDNKEAVATRLGGAGQQSLFSKLLPIIAPFVMAWLSKKMGGALQPQTAERSGGGLGDILGGMLGGGSGGGLGDLLGGMLGGGSRDSSAQGPDLGGILDILGGLAGGQSGGQSGANMPPGMPDLSDLLGGGR